MVHSQLIPLELEITEKARRLVRTTERDGVGVLRRSPTARISKPLYGLGVVDPAQVQAHASLLRMVSISEAYADVFYELHLSPGSAGATAISTLAIEEHLLQAGRAWHSRDEALKRVLDIRPGPERNALKPYIDIRNAIAHGLGRLTRQQRRSRSISVGIEAVGVVLRGDHVTLTEAALVGCADAVISYVEWLDGVSRIA